MSGKIISRERDPVEDMFWMLAIHYQILLVLKSDAGISVDDLNAGIKTTVPNRSIPEEAYSPVNVSKPTYTLADLLIQIPDDTSQDEETETAVPNRSIPEEAYSPVNVSKPTYTLADLLAQITEDNLHDEIDTGKIPCIKPLLYAIM